MKTYLYSSGLLTRAIKWIQTRKLRSSSDRRLRVAESVSFGDKRFVAVLQIDGYQYLVGGGATNIALLAKLNSRESFQEIFKQTKTAHRQQIEDPETAEMREEA